MPPTRFSRTIVLRLSSRCAGCLAAAEVAAAGVALGSAALRGTGALHAGYAVNTTARLALDTATLVP